MRKILLLISFLCLPSAYALDRESAVNYAAKGDYKKAYQLWQAEADKGDAVSQFYLGVVYEKGNGVAQDYPQALYWYIKAADQNVARAHYNLGNMFFNGRGMTVDYKEAVRRYKLAADLDYGPAQLNLGYMHEQGLTNKKNPKQAFQWYLKAANNGLEKAQIKVAKYYQQGNSVTEDKEKAIYWFKKALAQNEDSVTQYDLAMLYLAEKKTRQAGVQMLRETAEGGERLAQYQLGYLYGQGVSLKQDYEQATFWYKRAAKQQVPEAQFVLCLSYSLGKGVPVDVVLAHVWCEAAAENNVEAAEDALEAIKESMTLKQLQAAANVAPLLLPKR